MMGDEGGGNAGSSAPTVEDTKGYMSKPEDIRVTGIRASIFRFKAKQIPPVTTPPAPILASVDEITTEKEDTNGKVIETDKVRTEHYVVPAVPEPVAWTQKISMVAGAVAAVVAAIQAIKKLRNPTA